MEIELIKLESILAETSKLLGISSRLEDEKILGCWARVVKEKKLVNTQAKNFKKGVLYVDTTSPSWAHHLTIKKKNLLEDLNKITGKKVKDIRFSSKGFISKEISKNE